MLELQQVPDTNIIIMTATSKISGDDYENIFMPALEAMRKQYDKLRLAVYSWQRVRRICSRGDVGRQQSRYERVHSF